MISAQPSESLADGVTHQLELRPVAREPEWVCLAAVKRSRDACDEYCVILQPPVHLRYPLYREAAATKRSSDVGEPRIIGRLQGGRLWGDLDVGRNVADDRPADARKANTYCRVTTC